MSQNLESKIIKKTKIVDQDPCADLRVTDIEFHSQVDIIANLIESHSKDTKDTLTESAMFLSLVEMMADALADWEFHKRAMQESITVDEGMQLDNWSLDYTTCTLSYELVPKKEKSVITYEVDEDLCSKVQACHKMYDAVNSVINSLVSTHKDDANASLTKSPVFKGFLKLKAKYYADFTAAQNEVQKKYIPEEIVKKNAHWVLNYNDKILTVYNV